MKTKPCEILEKARLLKGPYATESGCMYGAFQLRGPKGADLRIISSGSGPEAGDWEHVSVSLNYRTPNWAEMCFVKNLFWDEDETVVQYHPPKSVYVNCHPHCLHLWRPLAFALPLPPTFMVGPIDPSL